MLLGSAWLLLAYAIVYWFYMDTRVEREEAHLKPIFGPRYEEYCAKVHRFIPGPPLPGQPVGLLELDALPAEQRAGESGGHAAGLGHRRCLAGPAPAIDPFPLSFPPDTPSRAAAS